MREKKGRGKNNQKNTLHEPAPINLISCEVGEVQVLSIHLIYFTFQVFVYFIAIRGIEISYGFENTCAVDTLTTNFFLLLSLAVHVNRNQLHTRYANVMCVAMLVCLLDLNI